MKKLLTVFSLVVFSASLTACNTMHGMGQDIERGGEKLQNSASGASAGASSSNSSKSDTNTSK